MIGVRQAIIVRRDLWLNTGMQIGLANRASMQSAFADEEMRLIADWIDGGCPADFYTVNSEGALDKLQREAKLRGVPCAMATVTVDSINGPTSAVLAIGPEDPSIISPIIKGLVRY